MALASGFQMAAHPVGIRPVELPFCIAPAIFARRLGDGVEPILHKVHDKARIIAIATFSEKIGGEGAACGARSEAHTSELQSLMRISYAVFCLKKKKKQNT